MIINEPALLIRLLVGHFAADFLLQSKGMADKKERKAWKSGMLYLHSALYAAILFLAAGRWGCWPWLVLLLFVSHVLVDGWKAERKNRTLAFVCDQLAHLAVLILIFGMLTRWANGTLGRSFVQAWNSPRLLIVFLGYLIILRPTGMLMSVLTGPFRKQLAEEESRGLGLAGFWIGCLERAFLLTFVLLGHLSGIALLLGLKSLFRFGEIKDPANRRETEYILIGTLLSFGFALTVGLSVKALLRALP
jgi:hypothetical protein